ncbi:hypothetical protein ACH5RR_006180 [Cinchona calisaya]|uniref:Uncharacterized protein n=1 Tax=Cinchona calisaya TaxID=153742 RepID=A0ABD3ANB5_9GENT
MFQHIAQIGDLYYHLNKVQEYHLSQILALEAKLKKSEEVKETHFQAMCTASKYNQENLQEITKLTKENQELQASHKNEINEIQTSHKSEVKKLHILQKEELKSIEKKSGDSAIFEFLDSQDYQDRMEKHLVDYHGGNDFEALVEKSSIWYFDEGYDLDLAFVKKKYSNLDLDDSEQGATPPTPIHLSSLRVSPEDGVASS